MLRRFGEALQRDRDRGRSKPSVTPTDVGTVGDFEAALNGADENIRLTNDLNLTQSYLINREVTIDLNGHSLTGEQNSALFNVSGEGAKLTLKNGIAQNKTQIGIATDNGVIVVDGGTYTSTVKEAFRAHPYGTVIVEGGDLTGQEGAVVCWGQGGHGKITVNGGHLTGVDNFAIGTNGSSGMGDNMITINGGTLEGNIRSAGYEAVGIYVANHDTLIMNSGEIIAHGGTGICQRGGEVTINNGTITATNVDKNGNIVADGWIGDRKTVMEGCSALIYHKAAGYSGATDGLKMTVNGGTITAVDHSIQVVSDEENPQVFVTGGILTPAYPEA